MDCLAFSIEGRISHYHLPLTWLNYIQCGQPASQNATIITGTKVYCIVSIPQNCVWENSRAECKGGKNRISVSDTYRISRKELEQAKLPEEVSSHPFFDLRYITHLDRTGWWQWSREMVANKHSWAAQLVPPKARSDSGCGWNKVSKGSSIYNKLYFQGNYAPYHWTVCSIQ